MNETVLSLAKKLCGIENDETDAVLSALCDAAESYWGALLPSGVTAESCGTAWICANAFWAAADYLTGDWDRVESFQAGEVSVKTGGDRAGTAEEMRATAVRLLKPIVGDSSFCFKGVRT